MKNILLIENDIWLKDCYKIWLKPNKLFWAPDAQKAIDLLDSKNVDLIILDMFLPFFNGMQMLHLLASHADLVKIPVVVLSLEPPRADLLKNYGVKKVLDKITVTDAELIKVVDALL